MEVESAIASLSPGKVLERNNTPQGGNDELKAKQMQDTLLTSFSYAQKEYIIKYLYPEISKALVHFICEAKRLNQITERTEPIFANNQ